MRQAGPLRGEGEGAGLQHHQEAEGEHQILTVQGPVIRGKREGERMEEGGGGRKEGGREEGGRVEGGREGGRREGGRKGRACS